MKKRATSVAAQSATNILGARKGTAKSSGTRKGTAKRSAESAFIERDNPLARGARGRASREEVRANAPKLSAPRQTRRPMERSGQKRAHKR